MKKHSVITTAALSLGFLLAGCSGTDEKAASDHSVAGTIHLCSSCHGMTGRSVSPDIPNLAAQQQDYLENQLRAFRDHSRADPHALTYMWGMAAHLDDATITGVAQHFANQPAAEGDGHPGAGAAEAKKIFLEGIEARDVPACFACHGEKGEGQGAIPRLGGQHGAYLAAQLTHFRSNVRANETMHQNTYKLDDREIQILADYLSAM